MGSVIDNEKTRLKCQIFTPDNIVANMLDHLGYTTELYGKSILESSCGNGQFMKEIVKRYIIDCQNRGLSQTKIRNGLSRDIYGIELDIIRYRECLESLNALTDSFGLKRVHWQIKQADALRDPFSHTFDFIVGNPPYVSYWDLDSSEREFVSTKYSVCNIGAWDYSYAFLQDGFCHLNSSGKMAFIVPNSIFKTKSGKLIRSLLHPYITKIFDYTTTNVFSKVLTSPAIIVIEMGIQSPCIEYNDLSKKIKVSIDRDLLSDLWIFTNQECVAKKTMRLGDYFHVATGVATQCNDVFVLSDYIENEEYLIIEDYHIEKSVVRKAASPRNKSLKIAEYIIFPYYYVNGNLQRYSEEDFKHKFPCAYEYLAAHKKKLVKRDADKGAKWFEYGRSQALMHINQHKLIMSNVITSKVKVYELERDEVPYSGLFIFPLEREDSLPLSVAVEILTSDKFYKYIESRGINVSGKSIRIIAKNILDYFW